MSTNSIRLRPVIPLAPSMHVVVRVLEVHRIFAARNQSDKFVIPQSASGIAIQAGLKLEFRAAGETPQRFEDTPNVGRQKDTDARQVKKNDASCYGYKNPISADVEHKLIREYDISSAEDHDSRRLFVALADNRIKLPVTQSTMPLDDGGALIDGCTARQLTPAVIATIALFVLLLTTQMAMQVTAAAVSV